MFGIVFAELAFPGLVFYAVLYPLYLYFKDPKNLRRFPGPLAATITNAWGVFHQYFHTRTAAVH